MVFLDGTNFFLFFPRFSIWERIKKIFKQKTKFQKKKKKDDHSLLVTKVCPAVDEERAETTIPGVSFLTDEEKEKLI